MSMEKQSRISRAKTKEGGKQLHAQAREPAGHGIRPETFRVATPQTYTPGIPNEYYQTRHLPGLNRIDRRTAEQISRGDDIAKEAKLRRDGPGNVPEEWGFIEEMNHRVSRTGDAAKAAYDAAYDTIRSSIQQRTEELHSIGATVPGYTEIKAEIQVQVAKIIDVGMGGDQAERSRLGLHIHHLSEEQKRLGSRAPGYTQTNKELDRLYGLVKEMVIQGQMRTDLTESTEDRLIKVKDTLYGTEGVLVSKAKNSLT